MSACFFCGGVLDPKMRIVRDTSCPQCGRDLHACVQCRHYDRNAHNQCREPQAEWVTDRERRNFCDYFTLNPAGKGSGAADREKAARSKLDSFFSGGTKSGPGDARSKLDSLFKPASGKDPEPDNE